MHICLESTRLLLRPPQAGDIGRFVPLLNDFAVAGNLARVPHPYTEDDGCAFVIYARGAWEHSVEYPFAILRKEDDAFLGICGLSPKEDGEFGYWIGRPYWGQGYATEATARMLVFAFRELGIGRLAAGWFFDNPASGHVLEKLGCVPDGDGERPCLSRGSKVICHKVVLSAVDFAARHGRALS